MAAGYDNSERLTSIVGTKGGTTLTSFSYSYTNGSNDSGLRQSRTDTAGNVTGYSYDVVNRLLEASTTGSGASDFKYSYDGHGNILSKTINGAATAYSYNGADQLTAITGGATYNYDGNGNETGNSAGLALAYNDRNQTSSVTPVGGSASAQTFTGASQAQRLTAGSTSFGYSALGMYQQQDATGTTYFTRDNNGGLIGERTPGGAHYYYLFDGLGSVVGVTDSSGSLANTYAYEP